MSGFEIAWSVGLEASGDQIVTMEQVVELADAVARMNGSAGGMGTNAYHATFLVYASDRERAISKAKEMFAMAVEKADMPRWEVTRVEAESEEDVEPEQGFPIPN